MRPSAATFRRLLELAPDAIVLVDADGRMVLVNEEARRIFGYTEGEMLGQPVEMLIPLAARQRHVAHRAGYVAAPRTRPMGAGLELAGRRKDGSEFPVEISLAPMPTEDGLLVMSAIRDVTDRRAEQARLKALNEDLSRQVEEALARERDYSRLLLEGVNALVVEVDPAGQIRLFNRAAETVTGYRRNDVRGRSWFDVFAPRDRYPEAWHEFSRLLAQGESNDSEAPLLTASGEERTIAWRRVVLRSDGQVTGMLGLGIDVTDRARAAAQRAALEEVARRSEKLAALGTLAAGLAHELNNPIGIMTSRIELMQLEGETTGLAAAVRDDLAVLHRNAQRVARIASGLLSFGRQSSGERSPVDMNEVVRETLLLTERQMEKQGITLRTELAPSLPRMSGDASALQQVVLNLVTNAWDAVASGGEVMIETGVTDDPPAIRLVVADTGRGIEPATLPRIFDPFFSTKPKGTGLGLSITDGIVREHGGTIEVESTPGRGTRFTLTFPV